METPSLSWIQELYRIMQAEGGEPMQEQYMGKISAEIIEIERHGGALHPNLCRAPMKFKLTAARLDSLIDLWAGVRTTGIVFKRILKRAIGAVESAAAALNADTECGARLILAQLLQIYLVSQVTGRCTVPRVELLQKALQALQCTLQTAAPALLTAAAHESLQATLAIGNEFAGVCARAADIYE